MSDQPNEYKIQSAKAVAKRALALSAYCCRGFIEDGKGNADAESLHERIVEWTSRQNLLDALGKHEREVICSPLGSLPNGRTNRMTWEIEGLAVLAWSLGRGQLPKHDGQVDPYEVTDSIKFLANDADEIVANARLREAGELRAYRELMYAIHCRVRDFIRNGTKKDFTGWVKDRWLESLGIESGRIVVEGDLGFEGRAMGIFEADRLKTYEAAICEQHRASVWLVGEERNHWETPADT